jgi:ribosomal-protein-serine acetyltransferase
MSTTSWDPRHPITFSFPARIEGERVVVRPYADTDAEALRSAVSESRERLKPWITWWETHQHIDETRQFIAGIAADLLTRKNFVLGIFDRESGRLLGGTGLHPGAAGPIDWKLRRFEIGYWTRTGAEGRGYVTEAVRLLSAVAFRELHAQRLEIRCDPANERSWHVAERCGFTLEGTLRNDRLATDGRVTSTRLYARLPSDAPHG